MNRENKLIVDRELLDSTLAALEHRSAGWRESAAVWAGSIEAGTDTWKAERVYFHHELCNDQATGLSLELSEEAKFSLYEELSREGKRLIALLHTHPREWVDLSCIDQRNQISSRVGFWSIVIPWYGRQPWNISAMGFHVRGNPGWGRLSQDEIHRRFVVRDAN